MWSSSISFAQMLGLTLCFFLLAGWGVLLWWILDRRITVARKRFLDEVGSVRYDLTRRCDELQRTIERTNSQKPLEDEELVDALGSLLEISESVRRGAGDRPGPSRAEEEDGIREKLIKVWEAYWKKGDGRFNAKGLQRWMSQEEVIGTVISGRQLSAGNNILGIDLQDTSGKVYLVPNFKKSPPALSPWFNVLGSQVGSAKIQRVDRPAVAHRTDTGFEVRVKGVVEAGETEQA